MRHHKIRQAIKNACLQLSPLVQAQAADAIIKRLLIHPRLKFKQRIGIYLPFGHEVNIHPWFIQAWAKGHRLYLPITLEKQLIFGLYTPTTKLQPNPWGIPEPHADDALLEPEKLDVVLTPLMAFDSAGYRLGRGKGYYDRTFSFLLQPSWDTQPYLIGLAYALQQVDPITPASWDVPLHEVITEQQHHCFNTLC